MASTDDHRGRGESTRLARMRSYRHQMQLILNQSWGEKCSPLSHPTGFRPLVGRSPTSFQGWRRAAPTSLEGPGTTLPATKFVEPALDPVTAALALGSDVAVLFVNDPAPAEIVHALADNGVKMIAMRCAGFDRVDLEACAQRGIKVARVPTYSPQSIAEHAVALMFTLNRHLHNSNQRVRQGNYALSGLVGRQIFGKTVGVVGTGAIGVECEDPKGYRVQGAGL